MHPVSVRWDVMLENCAILSKLREDITGGRRSKTKYRHPRVAILTGTEMRRFIEGSKGFVNVVTYRTRQ